MAEYTLRLDDGSLVHIDTKTLTVHEIKKEEEINSSRKIEILRESFEKLRKLNLPI